jgi:hypothetical protein
MGLKSHTIEYVREVAEKRGGRCLSDRYINNRTKLLFICSEGHQFEKRFDAISKKSMVPKMFIWNF